MEELCLSHDALGDKTVYRISNTEDVLISAWLLDMSTTSIVHRCTRRRIGLWGRNGGLGTGLTGTQEIPHRLASAEFLDGLKALQQRPHCYGGSPSQINMPAFNIFRLATL